MVTNRWQTVRLGEVITLQRGFDLPYRLRRSGTVPIVTSAGIEDFHHEAKVKAPGVVTGRYGTIGNVFFVADDFWPLNTTLYVRDFHGNDVRFVSHLLQTIDFQTHSGKSGVPGVNRNDLHEVKVSLPAATIEQRAIAKALSDADAFIESLEQLLAKKRDIKHGVMQELLTGKKRLPSFNDEWAIHRLDQMASIQRGASPRPIDDPVWFDDNSPVGWVRISDVTMSGMYLRETSQRLSALGVEHSRPVDRGSLIMSICATVGRPIITDIDTCIHDGFVVFERLRVDKNFLYHVLSSIEASWSKHGQTGSQMNLNTGLIKATEVRVPPCLMEQQAIARILSDIDAEIGAIEANVAKAGHIKQGMMQALLTGRIRLPIDVEQPARSNASQSI